MNNSTPQCDPPELWRPLTGMPDGAEGWRAPGQHELAQEWISIRAALKDQDEPRAFLDKWLEERGRAFAIETGQIEGLYTLKHGITEQLIAEGLAGAAGAHTVENLEDRTIQGLLADQETAYNMLFADIASGPPIDPAHPQELAPAHHPPPGNRGRHHPGRAPRAGAVSPQGAVEAAAQQSAPAGWRGA